MNSLKIPCNSFHPSALSSLHWVHKCLFKIKGATLIPQSMLIELAKRGRVAAQSQGSQAKRSASQTRQEAAKRAWCSTPKLVAWPDEKTYRREIQLPSPPCPWPWVFVSPMPLIFALAESVRIHGIGRSCRGSLGFSMGGALISVV